MPWLSVTDTPPPSRVRLLIAYDPGHLSPAIFLAKYEAGRGWYADGQRMPAPLYWMMPPDPPVVPQASSSSPAATGFPPLG